LWPNGRQKQLKTFGVGSDWLWFLGLAIAWAAPILCHGKASLVQVGAAIINPDRIDFAGRHCQLEIIRRRSAYSR
jgi:hypothetical protein